MARRPHFLQLTPALLTAPNSGAPIRTWNICSQLSQSMEITRVGFGPEPMASPASVVLPLPRRYSPTKIVKGLLGPTPISILNYTSRQMFKALSRLVGSGPIDIAEIEAVHMLPYLGVLRSSSSNPIVACDWHCFESEIMRRFSEQCPNPLKRLYAGRTAVLLERAERQIANLCDLHLVVSEREKQMVEALNVSCSGLSRP